MEAKIYKCAPTEELIDYGIMSNEPIRIINNPTIDQYKAIQNKVGLVRGIADVENFYVLMDQEATHQMIFELVSHNKLPLSKHYFDIRDDGNSLYVLTDRGIKFKSKPVEMLFKQLGREHDIELAKKYVEALASLNNDMRIHFKDIETLHDFYNWIDNITKVDGFMINPEDLVLDDKNLTIYKRLYEPTGDYFVEKALMEEEVVYRTYMDQRFLNDIESYGFRNKPEGGLWGCRDDSWRDWCARNDYPCARNYFDWSLKPGAKVYTIDSEDDFIYLLKNYSAEEKDYNGNPTYVIDFLKLANDYDAVELTPAGNNKLHYSITSNDPELQDPRYKRALSITLNAWDIPSICVFHPKNTVEVKD